MSYDLISHRTGNAFLPSETAKQGGDEGKALLHIPYTCLGSLLGSEKVIPADSQACGKLPRSRGGMLGQPHWGQRPRDRVPISP